MVASKAQTGSWGHTVGSKGHKDKHAVVRGMSELVRNLEQIHTLPQKHLHAKAKTDLEFVLTKAAALEDIALRRVGGGDMLSTRFKDVLFSVRVLQVLLVDLHHHSAPVEQAILALQKEVEEQDEVARPLLELEAELFDAPQDILTLFDEMLSSTFLFDDMGEQTEGGLNVVQHWQKLRPLLEKKTKVNLARLKEMDKAVVNLVRVTEDVLLMQNVVRALGVLNVTGSVAKTLEDAKIHHDKAIHVGHAEHHLQVEKEHEGKKHAKHEKSPFAGRVVVPTSKNSHLHLSLATQHTHAHTHHEHKHHDEHKHAHEEHKHGRRAQGKSTHSGALSALHKFHKDFLKCESLEGLAKVRAHLNHSRHEIVSALKAVPRPSAHLGPNHDDDYGWGDMEIDAMGHAELDDPEAVMEDVMDELTRMVSLLEHNRHGVLLNDQVSLLLRAAAKVSALDPGNLFEKAVAEDDDSFGLKHLPLGDLVKGSALELASFAHAPFR